MVGEGGLREGGTHWSRHLTGLKKSDPSSGLTCGVTPNMYAGDPLGESLSPS